MYSLQNLSKRKLRSWLTIIGIIIGIMSLVVIISVSDGFKKDIDDELASFGSDRMFIIPVNLGSGSSFFTATSRPSSGKLFEKDFNLVSNTPGVLVASKLVTGRTTMTFKEKSITASAFAVDDTYFEVWNDYYDLDEGRLIQGNEKGVAVLGYSAAHELFGKQKIGVGNYVIMGGKRMRVVGVLKKIGATFSQSDDQSIIIPFDDGKEIFSKQLLKNELSFISLRADPGASISDLQSLLEARLSSLHKRSVDDKDFSVITSEFVNATIGGLVGTISLFLLFITLISSFVSGIGIANTMFMSVVERTKEVGILKSLGATRAHILNIFVLEAGIIGFAGGIIGCILGYLILLLVSFAGIAVLIQFQTFALALLFSFGVGIVSGYLPARSASNLVPVEALRYD